VDEGDRRIELSIASTLWRNVVVIVVDSLGGLARALRRRDRRRLVGIHEQRSCRLRLGEMIYDL